MIDKPTILITSLGRTGTLFFTRLFGKIIENSVSLHEPDAITFKSAQLGIRESLKQTRSQILDSRIQDLILPRLLGKQRLVDLSDARLRSLISHSEAAEQLERCRGRFVDSKSERVYIESNLGYYGLMDVTPTVFKQHKVVYIIRDGRDWVRSHMNWGEMYGKGRLRSLVVHTWPTALEIEDDPYTMAWRSMSRFQRLCWAWTKLNNYALRTVAENASARVFRFENIFESDERYDYLFELLSFVTDLPEVEPVTQETLEGWLEHQVHRSSGGFPRWADWSLQQRHQFEEMCSALMDRVGYSLD